MEDEAAERETAAVEDLLTGMEVLELRSTLPDDTMAASREMVELL